MNKDDDMRDDGQDDETPEEMVNRSLAEAFENQQRYMEVFQNSAHMLQVLSRYMSDPIVVHDLEIASEDEDTSSTTRSSSSSSESPPPSSSGKEKDIQEPVLSHEMFGGCSETIALRGGRLRSARPQRIGRYRDSLPGSLVLSRVDLGQVNTAQTPSTTDDKESGSSPGKRHEGAGDSVPPKTSENSEARHQSNSGSLVSSGCQTQPNTNTAPKTNVGVGTATSSESGATSGRHRESIGVSTQTSIDSAMSEISKAADTIRRARTMLSSMNIGTSTRTVSTRQINNNNHKDTTGSDKEEGDNAASRLEQAGQGDVDGKRIKSPSKQRDALTQSLQGENMEDGNSVRRVRSILVNVKPSDQAGSSGLERNNVVTSPAGDGCTIARLAPPLAPNSGDFGQSCSVGSAIDTLEGKRQRTTLTASIGGVSVSQMNTNCHQNTATLNQNLKPRCFVLEPNKFQISNTSCPVMNNNETSQERLNLTIEMFQDALKTAIENLEKEGLWRGQEEINTNGKSEPDSGDGLVVSKIDSNSFALPSPMLSLPTREFLMQPCCSSSSSCSDNDTKSSYPNCSELTLPPSSGMANIHTNIEIFNSLDGTSSEDGQSPSLSNSKDENVDKELNCYYEDSTFGHCSSVIHLSPVMAFDEDDNTDDETNAFVHEEMVGEAGPKDAFFPEEPGGHVDYEDRVVEPCFGQNTMVENSQTHINMSGRGDDSVVRIEGHEGCSTQRDSSDDSTVMKTCEENEGMLSRKKEKRGFFRRLTSAISLCSTKKT